MTQYALAQLARPKLSNRGVQIVFQEAQAQETELNSESVYLAWSQCPNQIAFDMLSEKRLVEIPEIIILQGWTCSTTVVKKTYEWKEEDVDCYLMSLTNCNLAKRQVMCLASTECGWFEEPIRIMAYGATSRVTKDTSSNVCSKKETTNSSHLAHFLCQGIKY